MTQVYEHVSKVTGSTFTKNELTLIPAWLSNDMLSKVWDEITYAFSNFNGCTVEVWEWIRNFIPHFTMDVITYITLLNLPFSGSNYRHNNHHPPVEVDIPMCSGQQHHGIQVVIHVQLVYGNTNRLVKSRGL